MQNTEIMENVTKIMQSTFDVNDLNVSNNTSAEDIDEWDSLSHIELISNIESQFKIRFALGELQDLKNVGEMVDLISQKI